MILQVFSSDFRNTPLEAREKIHVSKDEYSAIHASLLKNAPLEDLVILSTCNRLELYALHKNGAADLSTLPERFLEIKGIPAGSPVRFNHLSKLDALVHLFKVASSLCSLVVGEPQILGQVKAAFEMADQMSKIGGIMQLVFERAFATAKRVRNETSIHKEAISISSTAVKLAHQVFSDFGDKTVLIVGAGEMAELAVESLQNYGRVDLMVANRSFANAAKLAEKHNGSAVCLESLAGKLHHADIVITSTGSKTPIITKDTVAKAMLARKYEPMFFVDIALPRDVDPRINELENVYYYDIDDLKAVSNENLKGRQEEAKKAEAIVKGEAEQMVGLLKLRMNSHLITYFREQFIESAEKDLIGEIENFPDQNAEERERAKRAVRRWGNKRLHRPTMVLREIIREGNAHFLDHFAKAHGIHFPETGETDETNNLIQFNAKQHRNR